MGYENYVKGNDASDFYFPLIDLWFSNLALFDYFFLEYLS